MPGIERDKPQISNFWCRKTMTSSKQTRSEATDNDNRASRDAVKPSLASHIVDGVERLVLNAIRNTQPLEIDPARSQLFGLFVAADEAGLIADDSNVGVFDGFDEESTVTDLSADSLCRLLARRWGLDMAAREAQALQTRLPAEQLERMRVLWSMMRMWMEWSYAWRRWNEFHKN